MVPFAGRTALLTAVLVAAASNAEAESYLRVIGQKVSVRSGPGANYREVAVADRGQVFQVLERGTNGYWFKIELEDGTSGWIVGDVVYPFEVGDEGGAPDHLNHARKTCTPGSLTSTKMLPPPCGSSIPCSGLVKSSLIIGVPQLR